MPTVAILGTRKLHYESKQEIDVLSKKSRSVSPEMALPQVVALNLLSVGIEPMTYRAHG